MTTYKLGNGKNGLSLEQAKEKAQSIFAKTGNIVSIEIDAKFSADNGEQFTLKEDDKK